MISRLTINAAIVRSTRAIAMIGLVGLLAMAFAIVAEVLSRWLLDFPMMGVFDFSALAVSISVSSCLPLVFIERRNLTVRISGKLLGPRINRFLEGFGNMVALIFYSLMVWQLILYVQELYETHEKTWVAYIPTAPWIAVTTALVTLCLPVQAFLFVTDMYVAFRGKPDDLQEQVKEEHV